MVNIDNLFINQDNSEIGISKDFSPIEAGIYFEKVKITTAEEWNKAIENFNKRANEYIPKEKIREKIEELNNYYKKEVFPTKYQWADIDITEFYDSQIELLYELLGE